MAVLILEYIYGTKDISEVKEEMDKLGFKMKSTKLVRNTLGNKIIPLIRREYLVLLPNSKHYGPDFKKSEPEQAFKNPTPTRRKETYKPPVVPPRWS